ncbi:MAG: hypothetical protein AAFR03_16635, partial [Pseudomonadota bacterium]
MALRLVDSLTSAAAPRSLGPAVPPDLPVVLLSPWACVGEHCHRGARHGAQTGGLAHLSRYAALAGPRRSAGSARRPAVALGMCGGALSSWGTPWR